VHSSGGGDLLLRRGARLPALTRGSSIYEDRAAAGRQLAELLAGRVGYADAIVLGLPRGGVPVAHEVARRLGAPLDIFVVRKLGVPGQEELAMGAIASGGVRVINPEVVEMAGIGPAELEAVAGREQAVLERHEHELRGERAALRLESRSAILVDDGLATGATMRAAIEAVRRSGAQRVLVAVPVAPLQSCDALAAEADELLCPLTPEPFIAVGAWYRDFAPVTDDEVRALLAGDVLR